MKEILPGLKVLMTVTALMWLIQIANVMTNYQLSRYGILPRDFEHLPGILLAPLLHWSWHHIMANTIPFVILGFLVHQTKRLYFVSLFVCIVGGLLVWLFARNAIHAGASGMIMGYFGFIIAHAIFTRSLRSILVSIAAIMLYGGIFLGLFDFRSHISFEGHIFGFLSGVACAWYIRKSKKN
jgi:membrane associated rhomboid family serine protease